MTTGTNSCDLVFAPADPLARLSATQRTALEKLAVGATFGEAAQAAGVNRSTLYRWIDSDPAFKPIWTAFQAELARSAHARLMSLCDAAVDAVVQAVQGGDPRVSLTVLHRLRVFDSADAAASTGNKPR